MRRYIPHLIAGLLFITGALAQSITGTPTSSGGGAPSGAAGGSLGGTYPNPTVTTNANLTGDCTSVGNATECTKAHGLTMTAVVGATYISPTAWNPTDGSGAGLTFTPVSAQYTQIGNMVYAYALITYPSTALTSSAAITGLPVNTANAEYARQCTVTASSEATLFGMRPFAGSASIALQAAGAAAITNATMSGDSVYFICIYPAN